MIPETERTPDDLDHLIDGYGAQLFAGVSAPARRLHRRRMYGGGAAFAVAASAAAAVVLIGPSTGGRLDIVEQAEAAIRQGNQTVLHVVTRTSFGPDGRRRDAGTSERWSSDEPLRWRVVSTPGESRNTQSSDRHGPVTGPTETSYADGRLQIYVPSRQTLDEFGPIPATDSTAQVPPFASGISSGDTLGEIRRLLDKRALKVSGDATVDGKATTLLEGEIPNPAGGPVRKLEYYVEKGSFKPIRIVVEWPRPGSGNVISTVIDFEVYEDGPVDGAAEQQLRITPAVGTRTFEGSRPQRQP